MKATQSLAQMNDSKLSRMRNVTHYTITNFNHIGSLFFYQKLFWGTKYIRTLLSSLVDTSSDSEDATDQL